MSNAETEKEVKFLNLMLKCHVAFVIHIGGISGEVFSKC